MFNIFLYLFVITCCGLCGLLISLKYSNRVIHLKELQDALKRLESEIKYRRDTLPESLERVGGYKQNSASQFFIRVGGLLKENRMISMQEAWSKAAVEIYGRAGLPQEDLNAICDIGLDIGKSDIGGQTNMFSRVFAQMEELTESAQHDKNTKGRMYKSMGLTIGVVIVIILI